ncbi:hypothetical protein GCM10010174_05340 [Kutzneria viridogrisea]|uniref:Uncharacterized protein n=2 Tax=Kutzneria TaxID=43356 RepID=W5WB97_9PSEU|nr:hypothetical protein [Kutzneria albida]AHH98055.1 hypothetical protein KALB_4693 [Kutzneria albida DSM 43870]MBA8924285.1 CDP-diglyceride synthetase [Kutzneria viridogrisea]
MLTQSVLHLSALTEHVVAANFLEVVRNAILIFLLVVFLIGGIIGFFIGRAFGRRRP